jgi:hypothetical protein
VAEADDLPDLVGGGGNDDGRGDDAEVGEAVAFVGAELLGVVDQPGVADDAAEVIEERGVRGSSGGGAGMVKDEGRRMKDGEGIASPSSFCLLPLRPAPLP